MKGKDLNKIPPINTVHKSALGRRSDFLREEEVDLRRLNRTEEHEVMRELVHQGRIRCICLTDSTRKDMLKDVKTERRRRERQDSGDDVLGTIYINSKYFLNRERQQDNNQRSHRIRRDELSIHNKKGVTFSIKKIKDKLLAMFNLHRQNRNQNNTMKNHSNFDDFEDEVEEEEYEEEEADEKLDYDFMKYPKKITKKVPIPTLLPHCSLRKYIMYSNMLKEFVAKHRRRQENHRCDCGKSRPQHWVGDVRHETEYKYHRTVADLLKKKEKKLLFSLGLHDELMKEMDLHQADLLIKGREDIALETEIDYSKPIYRGTDHRCPDYIVKSVTTARCNCYPVPDLPDENDRQVEDRINLMGDMLGKLRRHCKDRNVQLNLVAAEMGEENELEEKVFGESVNQVKRRIRNRQPDFTEICSVLAKELEQT